MNKIESVKLIKNARVKNTHFDMVFPYQNIIEITDSNGDTRILDLFSEIDITDIDYFKVIKDKRTKEKILFTERNERGE